MIWRVWNSTVSESEVDPNALLRKKNRKRSYSVSIKPRENPVIYMDKSSNNNSFR